MPDASRLHRAGKLGASVAVYTHRDVRQLLSQLEGERIHRAGDIVIRAFSRGAIEEIAAHIERRTSMAISVSGGELYVSLDARTLTLGFVEHRLA